MLNVLFRGDGYAVADIDVRPFGEESVEIEATFVAGSADTEYLERLVTKMQASPSVGNAYWSPVMLEPQYEWR